MTKKEIEMKTKYSFTVKSLNICAIKATKRILKNKRQKMFQYFEMFLPFRGMATVQIVLF